MVAPSGRSVVLRGRVSAGAGDDQEVLLAQCDMEVLAPLSPRRAGVAAVDHADLRRTPRCHDRRQDGGLSVVVEINPPDPPTRMLAGLLAQKGFPEDLPQENVIHRLAVAKRIGHLTTPRRFYLPRSVRWHVQG